MISLKTVTDCHDKKSENVIRRALSAKETDKKT